MTNPVCSCQRPPLCRFNLISGSGESRLQCEPEEKRRRHLFPCCSHAYANQYEIEDSAQKMRPEKSRYMPWGDVIKVRCVKPPSGDVDCRKHAYSHMSDARCVCERVSTKQVGSNRPICCAPACRYTERLLPLCCRSSGISDAARGCRAAGAGPTVSNSPDSVAPLLEPKKANALNCCSCCCCCEPKCCQRSCCECASTAENRREDSDSVRLPKISDCCGCR